jgi:hypothetical protein
VVKFVIVTTQWTGKTFFRTCLEGHSQTECPETIFPPVKKFKFFEVDRPGSFYHRFRSHSLKQQLAHWFRRKKLVYDCINEFFARPSNAAARGFKASDNSIEKLSAIVDWLREHDIRIIHFVGGNLLKRYVSHLTHKAWGVGHSIQPVDPIKVHINVKKLEKHLIKRACLFEQF